MLRVYN